MFAGIESTYAPIAYTDCESGELTATLSLPSSNPTYTLNSPNLPNSILSTKTLAVVSIWSAVIRCFDAASRYAGYQEKGRYFKKPRRTDDRLNDA